MLWELSCNGIGPNPINPKSKTFKLDPTIPKPPALTQVMRAREEAVPLYTGAASDSGLGFDV